MKHLNLLFCSFLPFIFFACGYYGAYRLLGIQTITIPALTGTQLLDLTSCEASQLPIRVREVVEDVYLEDGTIIRHYPEAGQLAKIQQPLELVITRRPAPMRAPQLVGLTQEQSVKKADELGLRCKLYYCANSSYPGGYCLAQYPNCGQVMNQKTIILYISTGGEKVRLVPNFIGISIKEIAEFLEQFIDKENKLSITYELFPKSSVDHTCIKCTVKEQKPAAGSFWDISKPQALQLFVEHKD